MLIFVQSKVDAEITVDLSVWPIVDCVLRRSLDVCGIGLSCRCCVLQTLINHLKTSGHSAIYAGTMCPVVVRQIMSTMNIIIGRQLPDEGYRLISALCFTFSLFSCISVQVYVQHICVYIYIYSHFPPVCR